MSQDMSVVLRETGSARKSSHPPHQLSLAPASERAAQGGWLSTAPVHERLSEGPASPRIAARHARGVFLQDAFLGLLEREKRRAERSKASFSVATFHLATEDRLDDIDKLVALLSACKRETDVVGVLNDEVVAILLPDTGSAGSHHFVRKITDGIEGIRVTAAVESYPDNVLQHMRSEQGEYRSLLDLSDSESPRRTALVLKRAIDLAGSTFALAALFPVMLIVAAVIALDSPGSVVYKQIRLGRRGRPFVFYKFRSMYRGADEGVHRNYVRDIIKSDTKDNATGGRSKPWSKLESDSRITPVGRFIRKTCLDELPQLVNVLKGDLSLVGPRPPLPYEASAYDSWHLRRMLDVKPGVTGLWQVEGRNHATFDDMVRMDLRYVRNWSLTLDLKILIHTALLVLSKRGGG